MGRVKQIVAALAAVMVASAGAGEEIDVSKSAAVDGLVEIVNPRGEVTVVGWDKAEVSVSGELDDLTEEFQFEVDDNSTTIEIEIPRRSANWGDGSDLMIHIPRASRVSFEGVSSDGNFRQIEGGLRARTASGDLEAEEIASQLNLTSVSGDVRAEECDGQARVSTVSGEIELRLMSDKVVVDSVSGDVEVELDEFTRLHATVVSGDLDIEGQLGPSGDIEMSSVSGDIDLVLRGELNARINVETGPGGDITNNLTDDAVETKFPAASNLDIRSGDGSSRINIRTVSGDINLGGAN